MNVRLFDLVGALVLGTGVAAQPPTDRAALSGWVCDAAGKKVVGADVTLLSRPLPGRPDLGVADEQRVRTGDNGMFRAELLHGRAYSAWAIWRDEAGSERRTAFAEAVFPGPPRQLTEALRQTVRSVRILGAEAWPEHTPLQVTAFTGGENVHVVPLRCDGGMVAALPALPGDWCSIEVRGKGGFLLGIANEIMLADRKATAATIELPKPRELRVVVVDPKGVGVAGACVRHGFGYHWRDLMTEIGRSDAEGVVRAVVPATNPMYQEASREVFCVVVEAAGRQRVLAWGDFRKLPGDLRITVPEGIELRGRLLAQDGSPVRGVTLLPDCYAMGNDHETTGAGDALRPTPLDAEGRFAFTSLHPRYDFRLLAILDATVARSAGMRLRDGIAVAPVVWLAVGRPPFAKPHDLGDLRFDEVAVALVEVKTHTGEPVPGARLAVTTQDLYNSPLQYVCDRVGRLQFPLPRGEIRIGAWVRGGGVATTLVRVPRGDGDPAIDPLVVKLSATRTVHGIVVGPDGKPVPNARVHQWDRAKCEDRAIRELTFLGRAESAPTGADGAFTLTLPLDDAPFLIRASAKIGEAPFWSDEVAIMPEDLDTDRLRIVLAPWQAPKAK